MQPNLLESAKQGDPQAITILMNRVLQPKGVTVKVTCRDGCMHLLLESEQPLDQKRLIPALQKAMQDLGAPSISWVRVYGRQINGATPVWSQEFQLLSPSVAITETVASEAMADTDIDPP
ncbi:hypothetical protein [Neosynechococcus sphagnicola]|uniref:hypothetical protein n=1 Tax=Neosynechococcus sphagnicola TaxID=1501145 RepID=UPI0006921ADB|nr:hypothetical protein [Neosynechococcus sphagnicola]